MQSLFTRLFPIPSSVSLASVGLDFSDTMLRCMRLKQTVHGIVPELYAQIPIPEGCLDHGRILNAQLFTETLRSVRDTYHIKTVRIAIPESQTYSVTLAIDSAVGADLRNAIELQLGNNIPLDPAETIFDFHVLTTTPESIVVHVVAIARSVGEAFLKVCTDAGMMPVSFEVDSQAIVRALLPPHANRSALIVDIGAERTGIVIATSNTAVYTTTLAFGGSTLIDALIREKQIDISAAHELLHRGINPTHIDVFPILASALSVLRDEIDRRFIYWQERKDEFAPLPAIDTVYLCGGYGSIEGLADYLSASLKLSVTLSNPWLNCLSFDRAIPVITNEEAQSYVTAIGLALNDHLYD